MTTIFRKIGIFAGKDFSTIKMLPPLLSRLKETGWEAEVYFVHRKSLARRSFDHLGEFYLYERDLLPAIYNAVDRHPIQNQASCFSPLGLAKVYDVRIEEVENVNSTAFLDRLRLQALDGALSLRCLQIFSPEFIHIFSGKNGSFLWNLHAGALPECRGAMPLFWTMLMNQNQATLSLHEIEQGIDEGRVINAKPIAINPGDSLLEASCCTAGDGASLILNALKQQTQGLIKPKPQIGASAYYSYPTSDDIKKFHALGRKMFPANVIDMLVGNFSLKGTALSRELKDILQKRVHGFKQRDSFFSSSNGADSKKIEIDNLWRSIKP